jgi:hypothetical protein
MLINMVEKMIGSEGVLLSHEAFKAGKAKIPPAHQGKFPPAPPSPSASAYAAQQVKGRFALRSTLFHYALDLFLLLRLSLLTTEVVPNVWTGFSGFLACLFLSQAAFGKFCSWHMFGVMPPKAV